jgi:hypothetical protein
VIRSHNVREDSLLGLLVGAVFVVVVCGVLAKGWGH